LYRLKISKLYREDTSFSYNYIKYKLEAPMAADNLKKEIKEKINTIKENPKIRPLVQDKVFGFHRLQADKREKLYDILYHRGR